LPPVGEPTARAELDRLRNELLSVVAHEMRTPLTCVAGYLELLGDDAAGTLTDAQRELVLVAQRNCVRLGELAEDLEKAMADLLDIAITFTPAG
jgi:signal transduction histidine kinase